MKKNLSIRIVTTIALLAPAITFAAGKKLSDIIWDIIGYLNQILYLMIGLAVVIFVWSVIKYYIRPDAERTEGNKYIMYSLIGFFVILSFWGLVNILQNTFGLQNESNQPASWTSFKNIFPGGTSSGANNGGTSNFTSQQGGTSNFTSQQGGTSDFVSPRTNTGIIRTPGPVGSQPLQ